MRYICGIDEAGRGSAAGSMFVSGVCMLEHEIFSSDIRDSKKLTERKRNEIYPALIAFIGDRGGAYELERVDSSMIDDLGLTSCMRCSVQKIMCRVLARMKFIDRECEIDFVIDGSYCFGVENLRCLVNGDDSIKAISAASIIAKYNKDLESRSIDSAYPMYGFKKNKGYLSSSHIEAIRKYGLSSVHRKSYNIRTRLD